MELRPGKTKNQETTLYCLETANRATAPYITMVKYFIEHLAKLVWNPRVLVFQDSKVQNSLHTQLNKSTAFKLLFLSDT